MGREEEESGESWGMENNIIKNILKFSKNRFLKKDIIEPKISGADRGNDQHKIGHSHGQALAKDYCTKVPRMCVFYRSLTGLQYLLYLVKVLK